MASSTYEVKGTFKALGPGYNKIDACINGCILYRGLYEKYEVCPTCGKSRWTVDDIKKSKTTARHLRWHAESRIKDGVLPHPADSPAWAAIDDGYEFIKQDPRSLRLGIAADGVDVNRGNQHHSVWPVLAVIYKLPPWLCMKRKFIMLSLLMSGTPGNDIDVFLAPLIEYLQKLFDTGVETYDKYARERFTLCVVVLWTINDYLALGTLCDCPYSGFFGCVVCGKETNYVRLRRSNKQSYGGHIRYLPYDHPFRKQKKGFDGTQEFRSEPIPKNEGHNHKNNASAMQQASNERGGKIKKPRGKKESDTTEEGSNDFMHIEKNVAESLIRTPLNIPGKTKDGLEARLDLDDMHLRPELTPKRDCTNIRLPSASYTLTTKEKDKFCDTLYKLWVPKGYCSNFSSLVSLKDRKLIGLKSHDYHMLMQQFFPLAIRSIMPQPTRYAIISKEIEVEEVDKLEADFFGTLEVKLCGPVCFRLMYPFERCVMVIKVHVRNKNKVEGCIAEQNIIEETIEFLSEFKKDLKTIGIPNSLRNSIENKNKGK
ncbi:uncharacterized protein LOC143534533 [Bidens hawaiensis]|uniref:uncharacterized protein LOC143534533 n=1 Tax=Bidens hawaiensis TaxID=980011 RepID=UPI00404948E1